MKGLLLFALAGCIALPAPYTAPIMAVTPPDGAYGRTICSWNNLPVIEIRPEILASPDAAILIKHEQVHAERMKAYKGGCWPFIYRYAKDTAFRRVEQMAAYCAMGKVAIEMNRNPEEVWNHIKNVMAVNHSVSLGKKDNCLYLEKE